MSGVKTIGCSERIREELTKRGLTLSQVSRHIGFSPNYLYACIHNNRISVAAAKLLETEYRIKPEAYADEPKKEKEEDLKAVVVRLVGIVQKLEAKQERLEGKIDRLIAEWEGTR